MGKYLGQHFLINKDKLREIVEALELKDGDTIVEIGPGHGELTLELRIKNAELRIIAIEKDKKLAEILRNQMALPYKEVPYPDKTMVEIIEGDALKLLPQLTNDLQQTTDNYKIVGNIPYYITGYLLRILGELENKPSLIVLTIQKEVAERICKMNLLAASVQFWAKPEIVGYISKKDFQPAPEVDSAIITLSPRTNADWTRTDADKYYKFIKVLFRQPRKTISNNLRQTTNDPRLLTEKLKLLDIDPQSRPQDLSIEQIIELSTLF